MNPDKRFSDYIQDKVIVDIYPANYVFTAHPTDNTKETWYFALRHGAFSAQVDKAVGQIMRLYAPQHTPEIFIIQNNDDYYVATKEIPNVTKEVSASFAPIGFGQASVLSFFVGESDIHSGNLIYSTDTENQNIYAHKIDHAESLNPTILAEPITLQDIFANHWNLPSSITNHSNYQNEQICTLLQISRTPFEFYRDIIDTSITSTPQAEAESFANKLIISDLIDADGKAELKLMLESSELESTEWVLKEDRLALLLARHDAFKDSALEIPAHEIPDFCA